MPDTERMRSARSDLDRARFLIQQVGEHIGHQLDPQDAITQLSTLERLQSVVESVNQVSTAQQRLDVLLRATVRDVPTARRGAIYVRTTASHIFVIGAIFPSAPDVLGSEIEAQGGYIDAVAQVQCPVLIADAQKEGLAAYPGLVDGSPHARSVLTVPFVVGGRTVGVLSLENCEQAHAFTKADLDFVSLLSHYTAMVIDNARLSMAKPTSTLSHPPGLSAWQDLARWIPVGLLLVNPHRHYVWANSAFYQMTGFTSAQLEGDPVKALLLFPQDALQKRTNELQEWTLTRQNGTRCPVKVLALDLNVAGIEGMDGYLGIFQDQSERLALETQLFHMQRLSNVGAFLSTISHELNNPLTAVIGFAQLILTRKDAPPESREELEIIVSQAERSVRIVQDLLDYVRRQSEESTQVDINHVIRQMVRFRTRALRKAGLEIILDLADHPSLLHGNACQLQQVMVNLVNNAEHACANTNQPAKVWIRTRLVEEKQCVRISIRDNGPGIPLEIQSRIFEPFFTTKASGEGTGLGLSISKQIVERHNGHIWLESKPGEGATFFIDLPVPTALEPKSNDGPIASAEQTKCLPARVLVVDDEKSIGRLLSKVLTRNGHQVDTAWDGKEGLRRLKEMPYDIVFLDLKIPGLSGQAIYNWIKKDRAQLAERTVILTGDTLNAETINFLKEENVRHLLKPFQLTDLRTVLRQIWP